MNGLVTFVFLLLVGHRLLSPLVNRMFTVVNGRHWCGTTEKNVRAFLDDMVVVRCTHPPSELQQTNLGPAAVERCS